MHLVGRKMQILHCVGLSMFLATDALIGFLLQQLNRKHSLILKFWCRAHKKKRQNDTNAQIWLHIKLKKLPKSIKYLLK